MYDTAVFGMSTIFGLYYVARKVDIQMSSPMPTINAAMSFSSMLNMTIYDAPFDIIEGSGGGRCGRAKARK